MRRKIVAGILVTSFMLSVAGCSGIKEVTSDDFIDACEKLGADEVDPEDFDDLEPDDYEDGVYVILDQDFIEENVQDYVLMSIKVSKLDLDIDIDDVEQATFYLRVDPGVSDFMDVFDSYDDFDFDDIEADSVIAAQITLSEEYEVPEIMDGIEDLVRRANIDVDDLNSSEWKYNNQGGYLKLHIDIADFVQAFLESDFYDTLDDLGTADDIEDMIEDLEGDLSVAFYVSPTNVFVVVGLGLNTDSERITEFCSELNVDNPLNRPSSEVAIDAIIETLDDYSDIYASSFGRYIDLANGGSNDYDYYGF
ncbi:MAG: hypothetical protein IJ757_03575 [Clostridiales bacterium]|nr:hypothetical protein [Clostridiales bacterium]